MTIEEIKVEKQKLVKRISCATNAGLSEFRDKSGLDVNSINVDIHKIYGSDGGVYDECATVQVDISI